MRFINTRWRRALPSAAPPHTGAPPMQLPAHRAGRSSAKSITIPALLIDEFIELRNFASTNVPLCTIPPIPPTFGCSTDSATLSPPTQPWPRIAACFWSVTIPSPSAPGTTFSHRSPSFNTSARFRTSGENLELARSGRSHQRMAFPIMSLMPFATTIAAHGRSPPMARVHRSSGGNFPHGGETEHFWQ